MQKLYLTQGEAVISGTPSLTLISDASLEGCGAFCYRVITAGSWTSLGPKSLTNV